MSEAVKEEEPCSSEAKEEDQEGQEDPVTMLDVLQDEESLEADAKAVLGNADDKNCTYHTGGYMKRQPLYACLTCIKEPEDHSKGAGICLACSYHCHEGCNLVELYTKRNFRCDCGNNKLNNECKLANDKRPQNERNRYNQNFRGLYCICHRPYPDPEDTVPDEMIQCIICEDWLHGRCCLKGLGKLPKDENYSEMICFECYEKKSCILKHYAGLSVTPITNAESKDNDVKVDESGEANSSYSTSNKVAEPESKAKPVTGCKIAATKSIDTTEEKSRTLFLPNNWRQEVCKCDDCLKLLEAENLSFLIDEEDTVHFYESQAKAEEGTQYEKGMEALSSMDRVKQMEAIQGYNSMKSNLMEYLKKFAQNGKVVRQEDIQEFFQQMQAAKRPRVEIPKFCK